MTRLYRVLLSSLVCLGLVSAEAALVHRYRLDETFQHEPIADSIGNRNATSTTLLRGRAGMLAGALDFEEADGDHLNLGPCNTLLPAGEFTVTAWVRYSSDGLDANERLLDCSDGNTLAEMTTGFNLKTQDGTLRVFAGDGARKVATVSAHSLLTRNQWHLVALRYRASSNPGVASNGLVQVTAVPFGQTVLHSMDIAARTDGTAHAVGELGSPTAMLAGAPSGIAADAVLSFDGEMDDVRFYDSVLDDEALADLHNENLSVLSCLRWIFNVAGDPEGWTAPGAASASVAGGDYAVTASGATLSIESPDNLGLDLLGIRKIFVKARNGSAGTAASIAFQTESDPTYAGHAVGFAMVASDPGYTTYEIDMASNPGWSGTLKRLRIELAGASSGEGIGFDRIAVGESGNRPNVIVMLADDLGWRDVTVNGGDYYQTPNVERLADRGVNFPNAHSANALCSPTRSAILTGLYPARVRVNTPAGHDVKVVLDPTVAATANSYLPATPVGSRTRLPNAYVTYAELMKQVGYSTAFLGKWHLGRDEYIPENQGFDFVVGGRYHSGPPGGYFAPFTADSNIPANWPDGTPVATDDHVNDLLAAWAADFIEGNRNQPFLMNLWWYDVHGPFEAKPDVRAKYVGRSDSEGRQNSPTYAAMVEVMDDGVGVVLDKLEALGLSDDTVIFFTGDNGGWMYSWLAEDLAVPTDNYPSRAGKACIWDGGTHVPFIVAWPGQVAGGTTNSNNVNNLDIYATILDMLGLQPYDGYALDSTSLVPSLLGQPPANGNRVFSQFPQATPATGTFPAVWVRQGDWKLIRFFHGNGGFGNHRYELYNIASDIGEENNLADANPALVATMDAWIEQHLVDTAALQPNANPSYVPPVFDRWTPNPGVWVQDGTAGRLKMVSNSFLPALDSPDLSALPAPAKVLATMKSRSYGPGRVWWKFPGDAEWSLAQSTGFPVTHDNVERTIEIPINPGAPVTQIRFQPSTGYFETEVVDIQLLDANGQLIEIMTRVDSDGDGPSDGEERLVFRDPANAADLGFEFNAAGNTEGWNANNITNATVAGGTFSGRATSSDPQISRTGFSFSGNAVPVIHAKLKASGNGGVQFFWGRTGADSFAAARRLDLSYSGNGGWQTITIPVSTSPLAAEWNNQTITRLRIDPISLSNATWAIDWIRASDGDRDNDGIADADEGFPGRDADGDGTEDWADKDSDNDGASDKAELQAGRDPYSAIESGLDADSDGYSDLFEIIAGTDPDDGGDHLDEHYAMALQTNGAVGVAVGMNGRLGRTYQLRYAASLVAADWTVATQATAYADAILHLQNEAADTNGFFTIGVDWNTQWTP